MEKTTDDSDDSGNSGISGDKPDIDKVRSMLHVVYLIQSMWRMKPVQLMYHHRVTGALKCQAIWRGCIRKTQIRFMLCEV